MKRNMIKSSIYIQISKKKHPKEASVLFSDIESENIILQLINECSDIFDFNMINKKAAMNLITNSQAEFRKV